MATTLKSENTITVYRGTPGAGTYVWSPFVTKVEARLRFAGVAYRTEAGSLSQAPRGKIPYISISQADSESDAVTSLSDSTFIIAKLVEDGLLDDLNAKLSPTARAHDLATRVLLEDRLYFYQGYEMWHENYYTMRSGVLSALPYPLQVVVGILAYRKTMRTLYGQGTGRLSPEEIASLRFQVWENINALLVESRSKSSAAGDSEGIFWVMGGMEPSEADAVLFGFISSALVCAACPATAKVVKGFPVIEDYAQRIHDCYFPDYARWD